jgi:hypothetical protein
LCGNPAQKGVPAVLNRLFDRFPIGHATGKIGEGNKKTTAFRRGKRTDYMGVGLEWIGSRDGLDFFDPHFSNSFTASTRSIIDTKCNIMGQDNFVDVKRLSNSGTAQIFCL